MIMTARGETEEGSTFTTSDGIEIFYRRWRRDDDKDDARRGTVICAHGLGEHSGRYDHVARFFNELGCSFAALDHRGHGRSGGKRGHVNRFSQYIDDLDQFVSLVLDDEGETECWLLGHSLGGLIALNYTLDYAKRLHGTMVSSPALGLALEIPKGKLLIGRLFSVLIPTLTVTNEIDPEDVSHDPEVVAAYESDELVHDVVTTRFYTEFRRAMERAMQRAGEVAVPILMMQAGADKLVDAAATQRFYDRIQYDDKRFERFEGFYHELFNETERERVFETVRYWLQERLGTSA